MNGEITFTQTFKLLGSTLAYDLKLEDNDAIECRIKDAQSAFSVIQKQFLSTTGIKTSNKKTAYEGLILKI
jgi:hypothetical protein